MAKKRKLAPLSLPWAIGSKSTATSSSSGKLEPSIINNIEELLKYGNGKVHYSPSSSSYSGNGTERREDCSGSSVEQTCLGTAFCGGCSSSGTARSRANTKSNSIIHYKEQKPMAKLLVPSKKPSMTTRSQSRKSSLSSLHTSVLWAIYSLVGGDALAGDSDDIDEDGVGREAHKGRVCREVLLSRLEVMSVLEDVTLVEELVHLGLLAPPSDRDALPTFSSAKRLSSVEDGSNFDDGAGKKKEGNYSEEIKKQSEKDKEEIGSSFRLSKFFNPNVYAALHTLLDVESSYFPEMKNENEQRIDNLALTSCDSAITSEAAASKADGGGRRYNLRQIPISRSSKESTHTQRHHHKYLQKAARALPRIEHDLLTFRKIGYDTSPPSPPFLVEDRSSSISTFAITEDGNNIATKLTMTLRARRRVTY